MCCTVNKADFYYGAFLSKAVESEQKPTIITTNDNRGIYNLSTDKGDYVIYIKYSTLSKKTHRTWGFNYSDNNIEEIKEYMNKTDNLIFGYVCAYSDLLNTEIAIASLEDLKKCIDPNCEVNSSNRVSLNKKPHSPYLRMYGTKRADILDGKENALLLSRNAINEL